MYYRIYTILISFVLITGFKEVDSYTLYRNSPSDERARIHVASFDASEGGDYNSDNCDIAKDLFANQRGVKVKYWCEKGSYKP